MGGNDGLPEGVGGPVGSGVLMIAAKACSTASACVLAAKPNNVRVSETASSWVVAVDVVVVSLREGSVAASGLGLTASVVSVVTAGDEEDEDEEAVDDGSTSATVVETSGTSVTWTSSFTSANTSLLATAPLLPPAVPLLEVLLLSAVSTAFWLLLLSPLVLTPLLPPLVDADAEADAEVVEVSSLTSSSSTAFTSDGNTAGVTGTGVTVTGTGVTVTGTVVTVTGTVAAGVALSLLLTLPAAAVVDVALAVVVVVVVAVAVVAVLEAGEETDEDPAARRVPIAQLGSDDVITTAGSVAAAPSLVAVMTGRGMVSTGAIGPAMTSLGLSSTDPGPSNGRSATSKVKLDRLKNKKKRRGIKEKTQSRMKWRVLVPEEGRTTS